VKDAQLQMCLVLVHHQRPDLNIVVTPGSLKAPLGYLSGVPTVATAETVKWKQWSRHSGVARCTVAILIILISDAPSESVNHCRSIPGKIFNFVPGNGARNVSVRSHSWIAAGAEPDAHQFLCHDSFNG
jgi:hypothetical protein